jgi:hypothetical protein
MTAPNVLAHGAARRSAMAITPSPVTISVSTNPAVNEVMETIGKKLAHALYYREMKRIMTASHRFFASTYQLQRGEPKI